MATINKGPDRIEVGADGTRIEQWLREGLLHRIGGPACIIVRPDGARVEEWWIGGHQVKDKCFVPAPVQVVAKT